MGKVILGLIVCFMGIITFANYEHDGTAYNYNSTTNELDVVYNASDSTNNIQYAINEAHAGDKIVLGNDNGNARTWYVRPLIISSYNYHSWEGSSNSWLLGFYNLYCSAPVSSVQTPVNNGTEQDPIEIYLENNVKIFAKENCVPKQAVLFVFNTVEYWTISGGENASIEGNLTEYMQNDATLNEYRHLIDLRSVKHVTVKDLLLKKAGGDGIMIRKFLALGENIGITNVTTDGCARTGIALQDVKNLTIENCTFKRTGLDSLNSTVAPYGTWCAIDIEPEAQAPVLQNVLIQNCTFESNTRQAGISIALFNATESTGDVGITIKNNYFHSNKLGISCSTIPANGTGAISIEDNDIDVAYVAGVIFSSIPENGNISINILNTKIRNISSSCPRFPILLYNPASYDFGNINFSNVQVSNCPAETVVYVCGSGAGPVSDVTGTIYVDRSDCDMGNTCYLYSGTGYTDGDFDLSLDHLVKFDSADTFNFDWWNLMRAESEVVVGDFSGSIYSSPLFINNTYDYKGLYTSSFYPDDVFRFVRRGENSSLLENGTWVTGNDCKVYTGNFDVQYGTDLFIKNSSGDFAVYLNIPLTGTITTAFTETDHGYCSHLPFPSDLSGADVYTGVFNSTGYDLTDLFIVNNTTGYKGLFTACPVYSNGEFSYFKFVKRFPESGIDGLENGTWISGAKFYTGDFNGDGQTDIFAKNSTFGDRAIYINIAMQDIIDYAFTEIYHSTSATNDYPFEANSNLNAADVFIGKFNNDAYDDILFINKSNDYKALYTSYLDNNSVKFKEEFAGTGYSGGFAANLTSSSQIYIADFNYDGKSDVLIKDSYNYYRGLLLSRTPTDNDASNFVRAFYGTGVNVAGLPDTDDFISSDAKIYLGSFMYGNSYPNNLFVKGYSTTKGLYKTIAPDAPVL